MQGFHDALDFCWLKDLGFIRFPFTWCNRWSGYQNVWIWLDRGVASIEWILRFQSSWIHHLDAFHFDHKPILLCFDFEYSRFYNIKKGQPFRFEAMWLKESSCKGLIREAWGMGNNLSRLGLLTQKKKILTRITLSAESGKVWPCPILIKEKKKGRF